MNRRDLYGNSLHHLYSDLHEKQRFGRDRNVASHHNRRIDIILKFSVPITPTAVLRRPTPGFHERFLLSILKSVVAVLFVFIFLFFGWEFVKSAPLFSCNCDQYSFDFRNDTNVEVDQTIIGEITTVDEGDDVGSYTSLAIIGGQPAISYADFSHRDLKYAYFDGVNWSNTVVDEVGNVGTFASLAEIAGQAAISYYDATNGDLKYAQFDGLVWQITVVDQVGNVGYYGSLAIVDSQPAISYYPLATMT